MISECIGHYLFRGRCRADIGGHCGEQLDGAIPRAARPAAEQTHSIGGHLSTGDAVRALAYLLRDSDFKVSRIAVIYVCLYICNVYTCIYCSSKNRIYKGTT
jgi:hypothetical protein